MVFMETTISDKDIYLSRMSKPLQEKLRVAKYIPTWANRVLDVGCADGTVTCALAKLFPEIQFLGVDLDEEFIKKASDQAIKENLSNVSFEKIYLRELLARPEKFDAVIFISVLHEFYTYGEGISSVLKALADAHELLNSKGEIVIRDMILSEYTKHTIFQSDVISKKIMSVDSLLPLVHDFEKYFKPLNHLYEINHFLLKYMYPENWERESKEHYVPVTFDQYEMIFDLLGMELQLKDSYLISFLREKWQTDFGLTDDEIVGLRSTGFIVAKKI
jgi:2-polyprenyl-3-methyl-5-hydroxy-6-metoxy-1,4-benzoquinol methylase